MKIEAELMVDAAPSLRKISPTVVLGDEPMMVPIGWHPALAGFAYRLAITVQCAGEDDYAHIESVTVSELRGLVVFIDSTMDFTTLAVDLMRATRDICPFCCLSKPHVTEPRCGFLQAIEDHENRLQIEVCPMYRDKP